jgi:hypothetical protein
MPPLAEPAHLFGGTADGPALPWEWARERLVAARTYWFVTVGERGAPHSRPLWGVWRPDGLWCSTANRAVAAITRRPDVTAHLGDGERVVIVEGTAGRITDRTRLADALADYNRKYDWDAEPTDEGMRDSQGAAGAVLLLRPARVLGWDADELSRATRWRAATAEVDW